MKRPKTICKYFQKKIVETFHSKGIAVTIGHTKLIHLHTVCLQQLVLKYRQQENRVFEIDSIEASLSVWQSLWRLALVGEIQINGLKGAVDFVSDHPFEADTVAVAFKKGRRTTLISVTTGNISLFLQLMIKKKSSDLYVEVKNLCWNDLIGLLKGHLLSDILENSCSDDKLSAYGYIKCLKGVQNTFPLCTANLQCDGLTLYHKEFPMQKEKALWIDDLLLKKKLTGKINQNGSRTYIPYEQISKTLIDAVICTEDPDFWNHKGISPFYIGYALRENSEKKKIARGASTITMQLVRNLFLSQNRTFARKAEESIIALLLENYYKISKETIIELYLNMIEFAPDVYGIDEASRYYFGKQQSDLSLTEILTLTYIIPRPVHFEEALRNQTEQLKSNLFNHIQTVASVLFKKKLICGDEWVKIDSVVCFVAPFGPLFKEKQHTHFTHV
jgi:hypothetical protein